MSIIHQIIIYYEESKIFPQIPQVYDSIFQTLRLTFRQDVEHYWHDTKMIFFFFTLSFSLNLPSTIWATIPKLHIPTPYFYQAHPFLQIAKHKLNNLKSGSEFFFSPSGSRYWIFHSSKRQEVKTS